jgi:hypothetical protein
MVIANILFMNRLIAFICCLFCSCGTYYPVYFDLKNQSIVPCNGSIKNITIESAGNKIVIVGQVTNMPIYVNKPNPYYQISSLHNNGPDYQIKLAPNTTYEVTSENGADQGPFKITVTTNNKGIVISASDTKCN